MMTRLMFSSALAILAVAAPQAQAAKRPDLRVRSATVTPLATAPGGVVRVGYVVQNAGKRGAAKSRLSVLLSEDRRQGKDVRLASRAVPQLARAKRWHNAVRARVPALALPGPRFVLVCADGRKKVAESVERNNCIVAGTLKIAGIAAPGAAPTPVPLVSPSPAPSDANPTPTPTPTPGLTPAPDPPPPAAPTLTTTDPASGSEDNQPKVFGSAPAGTSIDVYLSADCSGPAAATDSSSALASPGITVTIPEDAEVSISARATDPQTGASGCSNAIAYIDPYRYSGTEGSRSADWCNLQFPGEAFASPGEPVTVYGRVYEPDVTEADGPHPSVGAELGIGPDGSDPTSSPGWSWVPMTSNSAFTDPNNDEYQGTLIAPDAGAYDYLTRFSLDGGRGWLYCDTDGSLNGLAASEHGALTVTP